MIDALSPSYMSVEPVAQSLPHNQNAMQKTNPPTAGGAGHSGLVTKALVEMNNDVFVEMMASSIQETENVLDVLAEASHKEAEILNAYAASKVVHSNFNFFA